MPRNKRGDWRAIWNYLSYLYRYWDCCKSSCAKSEFEGTGKEPRICYVNMTILNDIKAKSVCDGDDGIATTCLSQIPFTINGCENIGFGFASVPGAGKDICGRCFLLEFTGKARDVTRKSHELLKAYCYG